MSLTFAVISFFVALGETLTRRSLTGTDKVSHPIGRNPVSPPRNPEPFPETIFFENFTTLNFSRWKHEITADGGGNYEFEWYTNSRRNSYVKDGILYIKPTLTSEDLKIKTQRPHYNDLDILQNSKLNLWGYHKPNYCTSNRDDGCSKTGGIPYYVNSRQYISTIAPIQSARLVSIDSFSFKYGKITIEAQLPKGDWIWPALWLLPINEEYGEWPASGEIDIIESRGNEELKCNGKELGRKTALSTLHWGPIWPYNGFEQTTTVYDLKEKDDDFHTWELEWTPNGTKFIVDGDEVANYEFKEKFWEKGHFSDRCPECNNPWKYSNINAAPFDKEFYIIINVAIGGPDFFPDGCISKKFNTESETYPKPWSKSDPNAFEKFVEAKDIWYPSWEPETDNSAFKIRKIEVKKYNANN